MSASTASQLTRVVVRSAGLGLFVIVLMGASRCGGTITPRDAGTDLPDGGVTADMIGTPCEYVDGSGENPTNDCEAGLTCLIRTYDGLYGAALTNYFWEDQFTVYTDRMVGNSFVDEGYCTLVSAWNDPNFRCPAGTFPKLLSTNVQACMKLCTSNADCGRQGYVCDYRYFDMPSQGQGGAQVGHCVRACRTDAPDCVRSGIVTTQMDPNQVAAYVAYEDLEGQSVCDVGTGICGVNPDGAGGDVLPGGACNDTTECAGFQLCYQASAFFPQIPDGDGICGLPCAPSANPDPTQRAQENRASCNAAPGYVCQAAFRNGHVPFAVKSLLEGVDLQAGGICLPDCSANPNACASFPGTTCGQLNNNLLEPWNGVSMCLMPQLSQ